MPLGRWLFKEVTVATLLILPSSATNWMVWELYSGGHCAGTPKLLKMIATDTCEAETCTVQDQAGYTLFATALCNITDRFTYTEGRFAGYKYVMMKEYGDVGCQKLVETTVYLASGVCEISSTRDNASDIVKLEDNGNVDLILFGDHACDTEPSQNFHLNREEILNGDCIQDRYRFYTSMATEMSNSINLEDSASSQLNDTLGGNGFSWGTIAAIVVGAVACATFLVFATFRYLRHRHDSNLQKETGIAALATSYAGYPTRGSALNDITLGSDTSYSHDNSIVDEMPHRRSRASGLWDDETIITARVPREKVLVQNLISRGGYGEVYSGLFNDEPVAVKMLLPKMRKSIIHLNAFLAEVKLMATLNHERIVQFVGVAWDSLTDLCVLSEYMKGGDLRNFLDKCEEQSTPRGFDRNKATIALHVAHSLTYLHSLSPPVLHRDLKSKNILLTLELEAKLTDFGVSRERSDNTMTGGVGSSRWMAPEMMMGERYDDKADMFSFGVVLAELDQHLLPYAHAKEKNNPTRAMPDLAILQLVAAGKLQIEFSAATPEALKELGMACVSINPKDRPTAADALYQLHTILANGL